MAKLKITIDPLVILALFLFVYFGWVEQVLFYIVALFVHEYSHYYVAKKLGYSLNNMKFSPFGASLNGNINFFKLNHEILVALAGPLSNLALGLIIIAIWWIYPSSYNVTYYFVVANASLFITNMLPLFPLDAGRIILAIIKNNKNFRIIYKIYRINSIVISAIFVLLFIMSAFNQINFSLLFIAFLLVTSSYNIDKEMYYRFAYLDKNEEDYDRILPLREYYIPIQCNKQQILKLINKNTYSVFVFVDKSGKIIKRMCEKEILNILHKDNGILDGRNKN